MKNPLVVSALALAFSATASAATLNFSNGSGSYSSSGITATVTTSGGSLFYSSLQPSGGAIGVQGSFLDFTGGIGSGESMTVTFNKSVTLNSLSFTNWTGGLSTATISYTGGSTSLTNSILDFSTIDTFALSGINLTSFTITSGLIGDMFLHDLTATAAVPVPGAALLLGSGLVSLAGVASRRKARK